MVSYRFFAATEPTGEPEIIRVDTKTDHAWVLFPTGKWEPMSDSAAWRWMEWATTKVREGRYREIDDPFVLSPVPLAAPGSDIPQSTQDAW